MSTDLSRLDNFVGTTNHGLLEARNFLNNIEASLNDSHDRPDPSSELTDGQKINKRFKGPVVLYVGGESLSGKTRFWLLMAELLRIKNVDVVFWADAINTGKKLGMVAKDRPYGDLTDQEFNWASFLHSHALANAVLANRVPNRPNRKRRLVVAEAVVFTGAVVLEGLNDEHMVEPHDDGLNEVDAVYGERYNLPPTPKLLVGKNRALTGARHFVRKQGPFKNLDIDIEEYFAGITAKASLRERGISNRRQIFEAQTEVELNRILNQQGYLANNMHVSLADRVRFGAPPHAVEMVAQDVNLVIEALWGAEKIKSPWPGFDLTTKNLIEHPELRAQALHEAVIPFYMDEYFGIHTQRAFAGLQLDYEERGERDATPITRITENYIQGIFLSQAHAAA